MNKNESEIKVFELLDRQFFTHELTSLSVNELDDLYGLLLTIFDELPANEQIIVSDNLKTIQNAIKLVQSVGQINFNILAN